MSYEKNNKGKTVLDNSPFLAIGSKESLVHRVAREIQSLIIDGRIKPGTQLPSQKDLADQMQVSRTVIREAIGVLVTKGLLETKHGVGTIVCEITRNQIVEPLDILLQTMGITLDDLHQVRSILEIEIAELAAKKANEKDIEVLRGLVDKMSSVGEDPHAYAQVDNEFHQVLARMSTNPLLLVLSDSIRDLMHEIRLAVSSYPDLVKITIPDHTKILECVERRDEDGASQAMKLHLINARRIQETVLSRE